MYRTWEAVLIGAIGGVIACTTMPFFDKMGVDDPVGASSVHGLSAMWGVLAVGLFADDPKPLGTTGGRKGLFKGGGWDLLGVQALCVLSLTTWAIVSTSLILMVKILILTKRDHKSAKQFNLQIGTLWSEITSQQFSNQLLSSNVTNHCSM